MRGISQHALARGALALMLGISIVTRPETVAQAQQPEPGFPNKPSTIFLPLARRPDGPPQFKFITPNEGSDVSGTVFVAVQPTDNSSISKMTFRAGSVDLGTDSVGSDGFQVILDSSKFSMGVLPITATAIGAGGQSSLSTRVTIIAPPSYKGTTGVLGATLRTTSTGSTILIPAGAIATGTLVTVTERTQEQVKAENGVDWAKLGVTFLGAIDIETAVTGDDGVLTNKPLLLPVTLDLRGFANRVQPGQALVEYRIVPDSDGDGADELQVINSASLAANGSILSAPINQLAISTLAVQGKVVSAQSALSGLNSPEATVLSGPPGRKISVQGAGFNLYSARGNVAVFKSLVDNTEIEEPGAVEWNAADGTQTFTAFIPLLKPGAALLSLTNKSTGSVSGPYTVTVEASPALSRPAAVIIDEVLAGLIAQTQIIRDQSTEANLQSDAARAIVKLNALKAQIQTLNQNPTTESKAFLDGLAGLFDSAKIAQNLAANAPNATAISCNAYKQIGTQLVNASGLFGLAAVRFPVYAIPLATAAGVAVIAGIYIGVYGNLYCNDNPPPPPPSQKQNCVTVTNGQTGKKKTTCFPVGMGAAPPPPGGPGTGNAQKIHWRCPAMFRAATPSRSIPSLAHRVRSPPSPGFLMQAATSTSRLFPTANRLGQWP
jgi:hypothetical protein